MELDLVFKERKLYLRNVPAFTVIAKDEAALAGLNRAQEPEQKLVIEGLDVTVMTTIDLSWIVPDSLWDFGKELGVGEYAEEMVRMYVNEFMKERGKEILPMIDKARSEAIAEHLVQNILRRKP